jgi:hypothetical protein
VGPTGQLGVERGKGSSVLVRFAAVEAKIRQGIVRAHEPTGLGEEGDNPGRSGPVRWPGPAGLKSEEKIFSK